MIYLDYAATSMIKPPCVKKAVTQAICSVGNPSRGVNKVSLASSKILFETRELISQLVNNKHPENVSFTMNSTMALNIAIKGIAQKGDIIITTNMEHNSVLRPCYSLEKNKIIKLYFVKCLKNGNLNHNDLINKINSAKKLINKKNKIILIVNHASNLTGTVNDIEFISNIAKKNKCKLIVDASQTLGIIPIDFDKLNIDILCFTGHKSLYGPQGTGGLIIKNKLYLKPLLEGGSGVKTFSKFHPEEMPTHLEAGTQNIHGIAGLNASLKFILKNKNKIYNHHNEMRIFFYNNIKCIDKIIIYGDHDTDIHTPIVSININNIDSAIVGDILNNKYKIAVRTGGHCAPLMHKHFNTIKQGQIRFSFGYFTTKKQLKKTINALKKICKKF